MNKLTLSIIAAALCVSVFAAIAPLAPSASISAATTNEVSFPNDAVGKARVAIQQSGASTNAPTVYQLLTVDANTNLVPFAYSPPITNGADVCEVYFDAQAVQSGKLVLVTVPATNITRAAVIIYRAKYGR